MNKKLKRSSTNKVIAGVCGGFGEYFNIDPVIIRIVWVLLSFLPGGPGFLAYLICALIIPQDDGIIYESDHSSQNNTSNTPIFLGLALVGIGSIMLTKVIWPHFSFKFMRLGKYWPALLVIFGIYIIINQVNKK